MVYGASALHATLKVRALTQFALGTLTAAGFAFGWGLAGGFAALFGASIATANTLLQLWHLRRSALLDARDPGSNMRFLYRAFLERFTLTVTLFALGLGIWDLAPLPLLAGFIAGQLGLLADGIRNQVVGKK